jgi:dynein heavy chain
MEALVLGHAKAVATLGIKSWEVSENLTKKIYTFKRTIPLISNLKELAIHQRHWSALMNEFEVTFDPYSDDFTLSIVFEMKFQDYVDIIAIIAMIPKKEWEVEMGVEEINGRWNELHFEIEPHRNSFKAVNSDKIFEAIEQDQTILSGMKATLSTLKTVHLTNNRSQNSKRICQKHSSFLNFCSKFSPSEFTWSQF